MRLTNFSDYSLRVLIYLGVNSDVHVTVSKIAAAYDISENHLVKVVHNLAQRGYITTTRGKGGGVRLARAPAEINLGEVVRATEENFLLVECFDTESSECCIESACTVKGILGRALNAFLEVLDQHTLADLLRPKARLVRALTAGDGTRPRRE